MRTDLIWRFFITSLIFAVISQGVHTIGALVEMDYYFLPQYFQVWSEIMMPEPGPPPLAFTMLSFLAAFITGVIYCFVYKIIMRWIPGDSSVMKGINFGVLLFFVGVVPSTLSMVLLINLPLGLVFYWAVEGLAVNILGGILIVKLFG
jgi:hypothetical protein